MHRIHRPSVSLGICGLIYAIAAMAGTALAQPGPNIDPKADQLLQSMSRSLAAPQRLTARAFALARMQSTGLMQEYSTTYSIVLERPNKLAVRGEGPYLGSTVITDGTTLTRYNLQRKTYKTDSAPAELQPVFEGSSGGITGIARDPLAFIGELLERHLTRR